MSRHLFAWIGTLAVLVFSGCTMCASTFDQCGPTLDSACPGQCGSSSRAGSVLSTVPAGADQYVEVVGGETSGGTPGQKSVQPVGSPNWRSEHGDTAPTEGWKASKPGQAPLPKR